MRPYLITLILVSAACGDDPATSDDTTPDATTPSDTSESTDTTATADDSTIGDTTAATSTTDTGPDDTSTCQDECGQLGAVTCDGATNRQTCAQADDDPCLELVASTPCGEGETCSNGTCAAGCVDECDTADELGCDGDQVTACGYFDDDACLDLDRELCPLGDSCVEGFCLAACDDACITAGDRECDGTGAYRVCQEDLSGCLVWSTSVDCPADTTCSLGTCGCVDACGQAGDTCADAGHIRHCANDDADACLEATLEACTDDSTCVDGVCQPNGPTCTDQCGAELAYCELDGRLTRCGHLDADTCWDQLTADCDAGTKCTGGACDHLPTAALVCPPLALVGTPVSFDASGSSDAEGPLASYYFQSGDGHTADSVTTALHTMTYRVAGTHTASVTVSDSAGLEATATCEVAAWLALDAPANLAVARGDGALTLTWDSVPGAASYEVFWSTTASVTTASAKLPPVTAGAGDTQSVVHEGLTNGQTYTYKVRAVNPASTSGLSAAAGAFPDFATDLAVTSVSAWPSRPCVGGGSASCTGWRVEVDYRITNFGTTTWDGCFTVDVYRHVDTPQPEIVRETLCETLAPLASVEATTVFTPDSISGSDNHAWVQIEPSIDDLRDNDYDGDYYSSPSCVCGG